MPPHALVFNSSWKLLADTLQEGHKSAVAQMSRIPEAIVCSGRSHNLSAATILQHASTRETTRPEDRAYSLMGLLGVRMSPDYGEGVVSALTRLLETVVNVTGDISVFSWSGIYYGSERPGRSMFPNSFEAYKNAPHGPPIYTSDLVSVTNSGVKSIFQSFMVHVRIEDSNAQIIQIVDSLLENAQHLGISASDSCRLTAKAYYMPVGEHYAPDVREKAVSRSEVCSMEILTTLENVQNYIESFRIYEGWNSVSSVPLEQYFDHLHTHEVPNNLSSLPKERYIWALARFAWSGAPWFLCEVQSRDASHPLKIPKIRRLPAEITAMMSEKEIMKGFQIDGDYGMDVTMEVEEYLIE